MLAGIEDYCCCFKNFSLQLYNVNYPQKSLYRIMNYYLYYAAILEIMNLVKIDKIK